MTEITDTNEFLRYAARLRALAWTPLAIGVAAVLVHGDGLGPAQRLLVVCGVLYPGFKWLAWCTHVAEAGRWPVRGMVGFLVGWPGLQAREFVDGESRRNGRAGLVGLAVGAGLLSLGRLLAHGSPQEGAVLALAGLTALLGFGLEPALGAYWAARGYGPVPLMRRPWLAATPAEFWGRRWNTAFAGMLRAVVFRPVSRRLGGAAGAMATFLASGLVHELIICWPTQGPYGGPLGYFALQGAAVLAEHRWGWRRRWLTWVVIVAPLPWCFPAPFRLLIAGLLTGSTA